jgi:hypothetical protein
MHLEKNWREEHAWLGERGYEYLRRYGYLSRDFSGESIERALLLFRASLLPELADVVVGSDEFRRAFLDKIEEGRCDFMDFEDGEPLRLTALEFEGGILKYRIDRNLPDSLILDEARAAIHLAFSEGWGKIKREKDVPFLTFHEVAPSEKAEIKFSWQKMDGTGNAIGTGSRAGIDEDKGQIRFDREDPWSVPTGLNAFHLETVAMHEIGHALGLGHILGTGQLAIMDPGFRKGRPRSLDRADIKEFRRIYKLPDESSQTKQIV